MVVHQSDFIYNLVEYISTLKSNLNSIEDLELLLDLLQVAEKLKLDLNSLGKASSNFFHIRLEHQGRTCSHTMTEYSIVEERIGNMLKPKLVKNLKVGDTIVETSLVDRKDLKVVEITPAILLSVEIIFCSRAKLVYPATNSIIYKSLFYTNHSNNRHEGLRNIRMY